MANEVIAFNGAEAGDQNSSGSLINTGMGSEFAGTVALVTGGSQLNGTYSFEVDPTAAHPSIKAYGWQLTVPDDPDHLLVLFNINVVSALDKQVSICELNNDSVDHSRRLGLTTGEVLQIQDKGGNQIGIGSNVLTTDGTTPYRICWYADLRNAATTRDIVWVWELVSGSTWQKEVDVPGHGQTNLPGQPINSVVFGSFSEKAVPTSGGPLRYDEMCVIKAPDSNAPGAVTTDFLVPTADGSGAADWADKGWADVDEIPPDQVAVDATSDPPTAGDRQEYTTENVPAGIIPLAYLPGGSARETVSSAGNKVTGGVTDAGSTEKNSTNEQSFTGTTFKQIAHLNEAPFLTLPGGGAITEAGFNALEAAVEVTTVGASGTRVVELDQIGIHTVWEHATITLPSDFPSDTSPTFETPVRMMLF